MAVSPAFGFGDDAQESLEKMIGKYGDVWYYLIALICACTERPNEAFAWPEILARMNLRSQ